MKVGKKALSCLLAIIMIVSSCSVCFSVLGATDTTADIYAKLNISELTHALDKSACELRAITEHDESLESYFMGLVGGGERE